MAEKDQNPPDDELDPDEDTPADDGEDEVEDPDQSGADQDADRLAEAQATITRQAQELALFRKGGKGTEAEAGDDQGGAAAAGSDEYQSRLEDEAWTLAETVYGVDAIEAYAAAAQLIEQAVTPADHLAAFEAYHQIRSGEAPAEGDGADDAKPTRRQALTPKVDANRSDLGPDIQAADKQLEDARKGTDLGAFVSAATKRLGFG